MSNGQVTSDPFSALVGKALIDEAYRLKLKDPGQQVAALQEVGVANPTPVQLQALQNAIQAVETLNGVFQGQVGAG